MQVVPILREKLKWCHLEIKPRETLISTYQPKDHRICSLFHHSLLLPGLAWQAVNTRHQKYHLYCQIKIREALSPHSCTDSEKFSCPAIKKSPCFTQKKYWKKKMLATFLGVYVSPSRQKNCGCLSSKLVNSLSLLYMHSTSQPSSQWHLWVVSRSCPTSLHLHYLLDSPRTDIDLFFPQKWHRGMHHINSWKESLISGSQIPMGYKLCQFLLWR